MERKAKSSGQRFKEKKQIKDSVAAFRAKKEFSSKNGSAILAGAPSKDPQNIGIAADQKRKRAKKALTREQRIGRLVIILGILCLTLVSIILAIYSMATGGIEVTPPPTTASPNTPLPVMGGDEEPTELVNERIEGAYTFLVCALDKLGANTDVILVATLYENVKLNIIQIPRDTFVNEDGRKVKLINASYAYGGLDLLEEDIEKMLGIPIDRTVTINISGFRKLVNAIGGVRFNVPYDLDYDDPDQNLHIRIKKGDQVLNGEQAEGFVRYRSGYPDADLGRLKAQKAFMAATIKQMMTPKMILKIPQLAQTAIENVKTNLTLSELVYLANQALSLDAQNIRFFSLPGETAYVKKTSCYAPYAEETAKMISQSFNPMTMEVERDDINIIDYKRVYNVEINYEGSPLDDAEKTKLSKPVITPAPTTAPPTTPPPDVTTSPPGTGDPDDGDGDGGGTQTAPPVDTTLPPWMWQ